MTTSYLKKRIKTIILKIRSNFYLWKLINTILFKSDKAIYKKHCLKNLVTATTVLDKLKINYWLTDGTLLGFYRDGDFIKNDFDVDLAVFIDELNPSLIKEFENQGMYLLRSSGKKECGLEYTFSRKGVNLDIFFFYKEKDYIWHAAWLYDEIIRFRYPYQQYRINTYLGHQFRTPENIEEYVRTKYGEGWRKPVGKWDWARDPKNIF